MRSSTGLTTRPQAQSSSSISPDMHDYSLSTIQQEFCTHSSDNRDVRLEETLDICSLCYFIRVQFRVRTGTAAQRRKEETMGKDQMKVNEMMRVTKKVIHVFKSPAASTGESNWNSTFAACALPLRGITNPADLE
jgi:hypothetical protein